MKGADIKLQYNSAGYKFPTLVEGYDELPLMVAPANIITVVAVNIAQADTADMGYR